MFEDQGVAWERRIFRAFILLVINLTLWVIVPLFVFDSISGLLLLSSLTITTTFIYTLGLTITGLQVLGALTEGMATSVPSMAGSYVASAYYVYAAVNGGTLALSTAGIGVSLDLRPLLYLMVLPFLFSAVRAPLTYLADENEAARPAPELA